MKTLVGKLNPVCRKALEEAAQLAFTQSHRFVGVAHYLLKLFEAPDTDIAMVARQYGVGVPKAVKELTKAVNAEEAGDGRTPALSPMLHQLLQGAWEHASLALDATAVRSGAVLQAALDDADVVAYLNRKAPTVAHIYRERLRADLPDLIEVSRETVPETAAADTPEGVKDAEPGDAAAGALDLYTVSLTDQAGMGLIDPIVGRDAEIRQVIDILMRRRQNNPILTGEAGVGKTAVVEGFAQRIASGEVPEVLANVDVRALDLGLLQAGAGVQGEFETRVKNVIAEVQSSARPVVLFIDEAHALIGAGGAAGTQDAANLLKPALARGELRTIAATTWAEYKKHVERDPALARRFQVVKVDEPDEDDAVAMLRGLVLRMEEHHKVRIAEEALQAAVRLSARHIAGRHLPDKAIGVLDTACARVAVARHGEPVVLEEARRRVRRLESEIGLLRREPAPLHHRRVARLDGELSAAAAAVKSLETRWRQECDLAAEIAELEAAGEDVRSGATLAGLRARLASLQGDAPMAPTAVDGAEVARVVSAWTGIPVGRMMRDDIHAVLGLENRLRERVIGQDAAIAAIAERIRTYRAGLAEPGRPVGAFLFTGPAGVGKTATASALAEALFGDSRNLMTLNMSEYRESHTVSKLKGAPPGYVGYGEGGVLTEAVRRNPYTVILVDEAEKAHPEVLDLFRRIFDSARLEDAEGLEVDFSHAIFVMTTSVDGESDGGGAEALAERFGSRFLDCVSVVPFRPLGDKEIRVLVALKLNAVQLRYEETHGGTMSVGRSVADAIAARSAEVDSGARSIDRIVEQRLLPQLSEEILQRMASGEPVADVTVTLGEGNGFRFAFTEAGRDETSDRALASRLVESKKAAS